MEKSTIKLGDDGELLIDDSILFDPKLKRKGKPSLIRRVLRAALFIGVIGIPTSCLTFVVAMHFVNIDIFTFPLLQNLCTLTLQKDRRAYIKGSIYLDNTLIYETDAEGTRDCLIVDPDSPENATVVKLSPDGQYLAYATNTSSGVNALHVRHLSSGKDKRFEAGWIFSLSWSDYGSALIYSEQIDGGRPKFINIETDFP
jgi:hypothetical protein